MKLIQVSYRRDSETYLIIRILDFSLTENFLDPKLKVTNTLEPKL